MPSPSFTQTPKGENLRHPSEENDESGFAAKLRREGEIRTASRTGEREQNEGQTSPKAREQERGDELIEDSPTPLYSIDSTTTASLQTKTG